MVYILEFERKVSGKVQFYIGFSTNEDTFFFRMKQHKKGRGAKLTQAAKSQGIGWKISVLVPEATRTDERRWKNWHKASEVVRSLKNKGYGAWL